MFDYGIIQEAACPRIAVQGRIDALSASELQKVFQQLILDGSHVMLADLAGVQYISSAGLRAFITTQKELKKVGGEMLLANLSSSVLEVFQVSGVDRLFRIVAGTDGIGSADVNEDAGRPLQTPQASIEYWETASRPGSVFLIGQTDKMEKAAYGRNDVKDVPSSKMRSGCGLAALGDHFDDYRNFFGEAMIINGNFFYYPAVRHPSVDFMLDARANPSVAYKFLHGFGVQGEDRYYLSFKAQNEFLDLTSLVESFLAVTDAPLVGVTFLAESRGLWGMNIKKTPLADGPVRPDSIFSSRLFPEWFDFPVEPAHTGAVVAATGIVARDPGKLPGDVGALFSGHSFHLHGGVFDKAPISRHAQNIDRELARVFNELDVLKIQHLLGQSRFSCGLAGLVEIEV